MRKQTVLFTALTLSIITAGSISMPHMIKAERAKTSMVDLEAEDTSLSEEDGDVLNETDNDGAGNYGSVVCYSGEEVETHPMYLQEEAFKMEQEYSSAELEIPFVYEYRGYRVGFIRAKEGEKSTHYMIPDASDVEPETIVKKSIDTFLDVAGMDLNEKTIMLSLSRVVLGTDGYTTKRYDVEVYDDSTIAGRVSHGLCYYGYLALSGEIDAFCHKDTFEDSQTSENTSELGYWPNTGKAAEHVFGQAFGKAESEEDNKIVEKYTQIVNDMIKGYGIPQIKEVRLGYIKESILYLFADMEDGKFDEIDYSLKYDDIVRYKKSTEPEFSEFFLITQLPEDLTIKAYEIIYKEQ